MVKRQLCEECGNRNVYFDNEIYDTNKAMWFSGYVCKRCWNVTLLDQNKTIELKNRVEESILTYSSTVTSSSSASATASSSA